MDRTKTTMLGIILAIIAAIIGFFIVTGQKPDSNVPNTPVPANSDTLSACNLFTDSDARLLLGADVQKTDSTGDRTMGKIVVTHCAYKSSQGTATILIRKAASDNDAKLIFESSKKSFKGEVISASTGDSEYWVANLGQYNLLKGSHWIITSVEKNKEKAQSAASIVASRL